MVEYRKYVLDNGLTVLTHETWDTPLATVNVLYGVGSRDEDPAHTGYAHLLEHLMFGGTKSVPDFDGVVSAAGGESNAFTGCDYTNYYVTLPADGLETALALEADRMSHLELTEKGLEVQRHVVREEYEQRYMNRPYGDAWLLLRSLCYKVHPYRWAPIGADISHVTEARREDVEAFYRRWYCPQNAILAVAAPMRHEEMVEGVQGVQGVQGVRGVLPQEPEQREARELRVRRRVPAPMVYVAWPMCGHDDPRFRVCDLMSDLLGNGTSSRLYRRLVVERGLLTEADAAISGDAAPGLMVLSGKVAPGHTAEEAVEALRGEARRLADDGVTDYELLKVQNKYENTFCMSQYKAQDRALALCHYTWLGDTELVNREPEEYRHVTADDIQRTAQELFVPWRENVLYYETER